MLITTMDIINMFIFYFFMLLQLSMRDGSNNVIKDIKQKPKQDGSKTEISQITISTLKTSNE